MEKIKKLKKKMAVLGAGLIVVLKTLSLKAYAIETNLIKPQPFYGVPDDVIKYEKPVLLSVWEIARWTVIPIAFIIGAIIYFKKSKKETKSKIVKIIIALIITLLLTLVMNYIITNNFNVYY